MKERGLVSQLMGEVLGTFILILLGDGVVANVGLAPRLAGTAYNWNTITIGWAFAVIVAVYVSAGVSGAHLNPAVSIGLWAGGRFAAGELLPYVVAQVLGGIAAGGVLYLIASGAPGFDVAVGFASNGFGEHSPGGYSMTAVLICEIVMTAMFVLIILGATDSRAPAGFAPLAIGLALCLIHLISIPVSNTSVNPARSTGVAIYVGGWATAQLWLFWVAPIVGALLGAGIYRSIGRSS